MNYINILINQIIVMFIIIAVGAVIGKTKYFSEQFIQEAGKLLFNIISPINVINSYMVGYSKEKSQAILISFTISIAVYVVSVIIAKALLNQKKYPVEQYGAIISNCGFLGLPIATAVCGSEASIYAIPFITCNVAIQMTYGVYVMTGDVKEISFKAMLKNTSVWGCIIGITYFFLRIPVIADVKTAFSSLASMVSPLSCLLIGINLSTTKIKDILKDKMSFVSILLRQIVTPLIAVFALKFVSNDLFIVKLSLLIVMSTPIAAGTSVYARTCNQDYEKASRLVCVSTLLCILTMPLITSLATAIW